MITKIQKVIKNPRKLLGWLAYKLPYLFPDKVFLEYNFERNFKRKINWKDPKSFNEKMQWLKIYDRKPEYTKMVDKYDAKDFIRDKVGDNYVVKNYGVWNNFDDIDFNKLPDKFVLKTTHDSGGVVIVTDKTKLNVEEAKEKLEKSLKNNFYLMAREWPYKNVKPRIIAEEYLEDESGELIDYKFFCFDGVPKVMFIATDRMKEGEETKFDFYDMNFEHLPFTNGHPNSTKPQNKPIMWDEMLRISQSLSEGIPLLRVDLYCVNGKLYVGELTFYHWGGVIPFEPEEWDYKLGEYIKLPNS